MYGLSNGIIANDLGLVWRSRLLFGIETFVSLCVQRDTVVDWVSHGQLALAESLAYLVVDYSLHRSLK